MKNEESNSDKEQVEQTVAIEAPSEKEEDSLSNKKEVEEPQKALASLTVSDSSIFTFTQKVE